MLPLASQHDRDEVHGLFKEKVPELSPTACALPWHLLETSTSLLGLSSGLGVEAPQGAAWMPGDPSLLG